MVIVCMTSQLDLCALDIIGYIESKFQHNAQDIPSTYHGLLGTPGSWPARLVVRFSGAFVALGR